MSEPTKATPLHRRRWVRVLLSLVLLGGLFSQINTPDLAEFIHRADLRYVFLLFLFLPVDRVFMAWKWHLLLRVEYPQYRLWDAIKVYLLSNAAGLILPLGGIGSDVVRMGLLKYQGVPSDIALSSILVERLTGIAGSLLMLIVAIVVLLTLMTNDYPLPLHTILVVAVICTTIGLSLILSSRLRSLLGADRWMLTLFTKIRLGQHWRAVLRLGNQQRLLGWSIFLCWLEQFAVIISFYLSCLAFQVNLGFMEAMAMMPVATILERIPLAIWGLGVREASVVYMAAQFGVSYSDALLVSLANFMLFMIAMIPVIIWFLLGRWRIERAIAEA